MGDADILVPETIMERPQRKIRAFEQLQADVRKAADAANQNISFIYQRLHESAHNAQTDEGFLEIDLQSYDRCYHFDLPTLTAYLETEHHRLE